ncbi:MAG: hypothetical protein ACI3V0_08285 [Faecousia sp.]
MKKIVAGIGFEITGVLMVLCSALAASMNMEYTTGWSIEIGRYWQTVLNMGLLPVIIIGGVLLASGIVFSLWGVFSKLDD